MSPNWPATVDATEQHGVQWALARARALHREHGLVATAGRVLLALCERLVDYVRVEELVLEKDLAEKSKLKFEDKLLLRAVEPGDEAMVMAFHREHGIGGDQHDRIRQYFHQRYNGWVAFEDGALIGYLWWHDHRWSGRRAHPHVHTYDLPMAANDAYMVDFYIAEPHRGRSNALEFFDRAQRDLAERGYRKAHGLVSKAKLPARWTYASLGWKTTRTAIGHTFFNTVAVMGGRVFLAKRQKY